MKTKMVMCAECGALALPEYMMSVTDFEGKPSWLCEDCTDLKYSPKSEPMSDEEYLKALKEIKEWLK